LTAQGRAQGPCPVATLWDGSLSIQLGSLPCTSPRPFAIVPPCQPDPSNHSPNVPVQNLRQFLEILRQERNLVTIDAEVDPCLEVAEIHRRVIESHGPALLFNRVKGSSFPVVTNLFGTPKRIELAFGAKPQQLVKQIVHFAETFLPPKFSKLWENRNLALRH